MELQVHLHQRLLDMLDVSGRILGQPLSLPAQGCYLRVGPEANAQQAI